jgi:serpin B
MTANGAKGVTLGQMEGFLALCARAERLFAAYLKDLPLATSIGQRCRFIWFKDVESLKVEPGFLQDEADYYGASIYKAAFVMPAEDINAGSATIRRMIENILARSG